ncbi:MAG: Phosphate/sulfate permease PitA [Candidatus Methanohalarchaeum thermophilum]|uniref:Phosphate/sulfate permease PitA n=1 Tax=Methanohalarchaeum thermophilum TaxID=1903181 RepID=A0A1Q6DTV1_METT1|nr:MAG: Phosphate/sulfate permease PitA [Candidatus Methanohalarchaeum thermophilum]
MVVFVGINIGGSSTGVAFGPAVGSKIIGYKTAALMMLIFASLGSVLIGPNVVETLGKGLIPPEYFTKVASIAILLFIGLGILIGNLLKVPVSTSETAVGAFFGMGVAFSVLDWQLMGVILIYWIVSLVIAFWVSAVIGRYFYKKIEEILNFKEGKRKKFAQILVIIVACFMAFSAGASNAANAIAPLWGAGTIDMLPGVLLAGLTIGGGAFLLGPRTMKTVGHEITELPLEAALIVEIISATIITILSRLGIPASLAISATISVIGLGWGRATRQKLKKDATPKLKLYNIKTTKRIIMAWTITPVVAGLLALVVFKAAVIIGLL